MVNRDYACGLTYTASGYISGDLTQPPRQLAAARGCGGGSSSTLLAAVGGLLASRGLDTGGFAVVADWLAERGL
jgi:hypothetical protein